MKRPISVGVLHPTFESWGGAEWFIHGVLNALVERCGFSVVLYTHRWMTPDEVNPRYEFVEHRLGGVITGPWDWARIARKFGDAWRKHDVLFAHNHPALEWVVDAAGVPPVVWYCQEPPRHLWDCDPGSIGRTYRSRLDRIRALHAAVSIYGGDLPWRALSRGLLVLLSLGRRRRVRWIRSLRSRDRRAVRRCGAILANSHFTAGRIRKIYGREASVVYPLLPGFDPSAPFDPPEDKEPMFLWVGRLVPEKRPMTMLEAWLGAADSPELSAFRLVMVGDGPLRVEAQERIDAAGRMGRVELRSGLSRGELKDLYGRALLTVHLASGEPFGLVPLESMWEGTAVLAVCDGGVMETVVPGQTGFCLESPDPSDLSEAMRRLARHPKELEVLGTRAASAVRRRFSFRATVDVITSQLVLATEGFRRSGAGIAPSPR